jgi:hypothetical protein
MKKYFLPALAIGLIGASIAGIAHSTPMDHSSFGMQGMMGMNHSEMQAMHEAKTDEERQALMTEHQKQMMEKHAHTMSSNGDGQGMSGMLGNMAERQQMMQKRMGMGMMPM